MSETTPIRVLIVDDQMLLRQSFQTLLELEGDAVAVVGAAGDGEEALALLERLDQRGTLPEVVLMDVRMPRLDGVQATARIAKRWPDIGVLILTTFDDEEYIVEGFRSGAKGYLLKDASGQQLVEAIRAVHRGESPLQPSVAAKLVARLAQTPAAAPQGAAPRAPASGPARHLRMENGLPVEELTEREREILRAIARGASNREIGEALFITEGTVKNHVSNILNKLALRDRTQAALWAREHNVV